MRAVPPPGSRRGGSGRHCQQLLLPYKAGGRATPGEGLRPPGLLLRYPNGAGLGAQRHPEPRSVQSRPWASQVSLPGWQGQGAGVAREPRARDALCHPPPRWAGSPGERGCRLCASPRLRQLCETPGAGWSGARSGQFPGQPGSRGGRRATGREGGKARPREGRPVCEPEIASGRASRR